MVLAMIPLYGGAGPGCLEHIILSISSLALSVHPTMHVVMGIAKVNLSSALNYCWLTVHWRYAERVYAHKPDRSDGDEQHLDTQKGTKEMEVATKDRTASRRSTHAV